MPQEAKREAALAARALRRKVSTHAKVAGLMSPSKAKTDGGGAEEEREGGEGGSEGPSVVVEASSA